MSLTGRNVPNEVKHSTAFLFLKPTPEECRLAFAGRVVHKPWFHRGKLAGERKMAMDAMDVVDVRPRGAKGCAGRSGRMGGGPAGAATVAAEL